MSNETVKGCAITGCLEPLASSNLYCDTHQEVTPQDVRADEREQCCKDICGGCSRDLPVTRKPLGWYHLSTPGRRLTCDASRIRERAWKGKRESEICG